MAKNASKSPEFTWVVLPTQCGEVEVARFRVADLVPAVEHGRECLRTLEKLCETRGLPDYMEWLFPGRVEFGYRLYGEDGSRAKVIASNVKPPFNLANRRVDSVAIRIQRNGFDITAMEAESVVLVETELLPWGDWDFLFGKRRLKAAATILDAGDEAEFLDVAGKPLPDENEDENKDEEDEENQEDEEN